MNALLAGRHLARHVGPVLPVRGKVPLWERWPERATRNVEDGPEWRVATGVGLTTGRQSGFFVLDVDRKGLSAFSDLEDTFGQLPKTWKQCTGGGGWQLFFAAPDFDVKNSRSKIAPGIDIRGDGGFVVVPPSFHPNGNQYSWAWNQSFMDQPLAQASRWLIDNLDRREETEIINDTLSISASDRLIARARAYIARMPAAVSGDGGHDATFRVAVALVRGFGIDPVNASWIMSTDYNPRCCPPWTEDELTHKVVSAFKHSYRRKNFILNGSVLDPSPGLQALNL